MKRLGLISAFIAVGVTAGVAPVTAADLGPVYKGSAPAFNWNGFYIGADVGGAWTGNTVTQSDLTSPFSTTNVSSSGVVGGGHVGYNWQAAPNWLLGIEADVSGADLKGSGFYGPLVRFDEKVNAFGTARGRLGYVAGNWLIYGTGGLAWDDDTFTRTQIGLPTTGASPLVGDVRTNAANRMGWVAGAGIEYGFARNWTTRVEYQHVDLGDQSFSFTAPGFIVGSGPGPVFRSIDEGRLTIDSVRVGVSYKFDH